MKDVINRILKHWTSLVEYFTDFIYNSTEQSLKEAKKSDRFKRIYAVLKPEKVSQTYARLQMISYLCSKSQIYLKTFQSSDPKAYRLHSDSCMLIVSFMSGFIAPEHVPTVCSGIEISSVDLGKVSKKKWNFPLRA